MTTRRIDYCVTFDNTRQQYRLRIQNTVTHHSWKGLPGWAKVMFLEDQRETRSNDRYHKVMGRLHGLPAHKPVVMPLFLRNEIYDTDISWLIGKPYPVSIRDWLIHEPVGKHTHTPMGPRGKETGGGE